MTTETSDDFDNPETVPALLELIDQLCDQWAEFVNTEHPEPFTHLRGSRSPAADGAHRNSPVLLI